MTTATTTSVSTAGRTYASLRAAWIPMLALCLAFFVEMVDNTLLTIALPTIGSDLGSGTTALQWVTGAYSLTFGGLLLTAGSGAEALEICEKNDIDMILLDVMMPVMDGFEVCRRLKANPRTHHVPVLMITALDQLSDRVKGLDLPTGKVLGLDAHGWRRGPPQDGGVTCWYEKKVSAGTVLLDLDPGIFTGMLSESPRQKLGLVTLGKEGGWWRKEEAIAFGKLSRVEASELLRDLESLKES